MRKTMNIVERPKVLYLFNAYVESNQIPILEDSLIPKETRVALVVFNTSLKEVYARVSLPHPTGIQKFIKKIESHQKQEFSFVTHDDCSIKDFELKALDLENEESTREDENDKTSFYEKETNKRKREEKTSESLKNDPVAKRQCSTIQDSNDSTSDMNILIKLMDLTKKQNVPLDQPIVPGHPMLLSLKSTDTIRKKIVCRVSRVADDSEIIKIIKIFENSAEAQCVFKPEKEDGTINIAILAARIGRDKIAPERDAPLFNWSQDILLQNN